MITGSESETTAECQGEAFCMRAPRTGAADEIGNNHLSVYKQPYRPRPPL